MYGTTSVRNIPRLRTYADASIRERTVKPIRGNAEGLKPVGNRKQKHISIRRQNDDIIVRLYNTDVVTYQQDGTIIIDNGGRSSRTTHDVITRLTGERVFAHKGQTWVECYFRDPRDHLLCGYLPLKGVTKFHGADIPLPGNPDRRFLNTWLNLTPTFPTVSRVNKEESKQARLAYRPFLAHAKTTFNLLEGAEFSYQTRVEALNAYPWKHVPNYLPVSDLAEFLQWCLPENKDKWFNAIVVISRYLELDIKTFTNVLYALIAKLHPQCLRDEFLYTGALT